MKTIGLDIGTTTISAVVYNSCHGVLAARTAENDSVLFGNAWEHLQDPHRIFSTTSSVLKELLGLYPDAEAVGLSCQMHGILYLDNCGNAVSPLYTWHNRRGDPPFDKCCSWAEHLSDLTGYPLSIGYGIRIS